MEIEEKTEILNFIASLELFSQLSQEEFDSMIPFFKTMKVKEGEWLFKEEDLGENIYIIRSGSAEVLKKHKDSAKFELISVLEKGDYFGEMAPVSKTSRSASVRASQDGEVLILLFKDLEVSPSCHSIYSKIYNQIIRRISQRLRTTDEHLVNVLKEKYELAQARLETGKAIFLMIIVVAFFLNLTQILGTAIPGGTQYYKIEFPVAGFLFGVFSLLLIWKSSYPLEFYGLTLKNGWKVALEAVVWTIPVLLLMIGVKWELVKTVSLLKDTPIFDLAGAAPSTSEVWFYSILYMFLVPPQELVARGLLQSCLKNFFHGRYSFILAIIAASLIFEIPHIPDSMWIALSSLVLGIFWGFLYNYQNSLIGVIISHMLIGWFGFFALNFPGAMNKLFPS
jgi:CRP-like cAMP-binding protein